MVGAPERSSVLGALKLGADQRSQGQPPKIQSNLAEGLFVFPRYARKECIRDLNELGVLSTWQPFFRHTPLESSQKHAVYGSAWSNLHLRITSAQVLPCLGGPDVLEGRVVENVLQ